MADNDTKPKDGETPNDGGNTETKPKDGEKPAGDESAQNRIKELNEESKKHRLENKELKEKLTKFEKALAMLSGKDGSDAPDPTALEKQKADARARNLLLKAEFTSIAAKEGVRDASLAFKAFASELSDVTVDLDKETVDTKALTEKVQALKKSHDFMFAGPNKGGTDGDHAPVDPPPDRGGQPAPGAKQHYEQWQQMLQKAGTNPSLRREAAAYYQQHQKDIHPFIANGG